MFIAIAGFLGFDYKDRMLWQNIVFGGVYVFFGAVLWILAGLAYERAENLMGAVYTFGIGVSFATLGFFAIANGMLRNLILRRQEERKERVA